MKNIFATLFLALVLNSSAQAQSYNQVIPSILVTGTAINEIAPDQIYISITLTEKSIENKKYSIEVQEEKLKQILSDLKVDPKNLTLSDLTSQILRDKKNEIGFKQSKEYLLLLRNADEVSILFKKLFDANIKEADVLKIMHSNITEITKQVRIDALKAAKTKAQYLLAAVGKEIGEPLEIIEVNGRDQNYYRGNVFSAETAADSTSTSDFKKITINVSYMVKYAIK